MKRELHLVERDQSGEGYKRISKIFDEPWNTVKAIIKKEVEKMGHHSEISKNRMSLLSTQRTQPR